MKKLTLILIALLISVPCFAQEVTKEILSDVEILALRELVAQKTQLIDIAKTLDLETIPLEIKKLRVSREDKIKERDALIVIEKEKAQTAINNLMNSYELEIDAIESQIKTEEAKL